MKRHIITIIALACVVYAHAQSITLKECIERGLENSYQIKMVNNDETQAANNDTWGNAGAVPTVNATGTYSGAIRNNGGHTHSLNSSIRAEMTVFNGFSILTSRSKLEELHRAGTIQTRIAIEDYVASLASEYYNMVRQAIHLKNLDYAVALSKERLRIVQARYDIGDNSRLDMQQAQVYFNADSASSLKQHELVASANIRMNKLMSNSNLNEHILAADTSIILLEQLNYDDLLQNMLETNADLLKAETNKTIAQLDKKSVVSRNYPYLKVNAGYGLSWNNTTSRHQYGPEFGATVGINLIDGTHRTKQRNANLEILNAELAVEELELELMANLEDFWQAYQNNLRLLALERQNLLTAQDNYDIAYERYLLGDLSGIEMREAQKSLLDAEESLLQVEYDTKICEISLLQISGKILDYIK